MIIRPASVSDIEAIRRIQADSPAAAGWNPADYLAYDCRVAVDGGDVAGFLVAHCGLESETEVLNLAVAPQFRRRGVARALMADLLSRRSGNFFLEVRESNLIARRFYESLGFQVVGKRCGYYQFPPDAAVVMILHSC